MSKTIFWTITVFFLILTEMSAQNINSAIALRFQDIPDSLSPYGLVYELSSRNLEFKNKEQELFLSVGFLEIRYSSEIDEAWSEFLIGIYLNSHSQSKIAFPLGSIYFNGSLKPQANGYYSGAIQGLIFEKKVLFAELEFMFENKIYSSVNNLKIFYGGGLEILNSPNVEDNFKFRIGPKSKLIIPLKNKINLTIGSSLFYELSKINKSFLLKLTLDFGGRGNFIF